MKNKMLLLGMGALVALVFAALPAVASAGEFGLHNQNNVAPGAFTSAGGASALLAEGQEPVNCTENTGTGKYNTATTGEIELTFKHCTTKVSGSTVNCTTSGKTTGEITTNTAVFHNVELEPNPAIEPLGILITGPAAGFAKFVCGGLQTIVVTGNVIGEITNENCNSAKRNSFEVNFSTKPGATEPTQKWEQVTTTGTVYDLTADFSGFPTNTANVTAAQVSEGTVTFAGGQEVTPTCV